MMYKVVINKKNRKAKLDWMNKNVECGRHVYLINGRYRILIHAFLTDEELIIYKLMFGL